MDVSLFKAICVKCKHNFSVPLLSDFSYGEFIAKNVDGKTFAHLSSFNEHGWQQVESLIRTILKEELSSREVQFLIGKCLDLVHNKEMSIVNGYSCPSCGSLEVKVPASDRKVGFTNIQEGTFHLFLKLDREAQIAKLKAALDESR